MTYDFMKKLFLNKYHQNIKDWYRLVGEFFENTDGWTKPYITNVVVDYVNKTILIVSWDDYSWEVEELE